MNHRLKQASSKVVFFFFFPVYKVNIFTIMNFDLLVSFQFTCDFCMSNEIKEEKHLHVFLYSHVDIARTLFICIGFSFLEQEIAYFYYC